MKVDEVREKAKVWGIKTNRMKKADLIRQIQKAEGNFDCFGSGKDNVISWIAAFGRTVCGCRGPNKEEIYE